MIRATAQPPHDSIEDALRRFVRRRRAAEALRSLALAGLAALLWLLAWGVVDRFVQLPSMVRLPLLLALMAVVAALLGPPMLALSRRRFDHRAAAEQIEACDPRFREALVTVVSHRWASPHRHDASPELIEHLAEQVQDALAQSPRPQIPGGVRQAARAWGALLIGILLIVGLSLWPWLNLPRLIARQLRPGAAIEPVTTTRLSDLTASADVVQGSPFTISARVEPEPRSAVVRTSTDGRTWSTFPMSRSADGSFSHTLASVSRDTAFQVAAGDALSPSRTLRVLRQPFVREIRIRLTYPDYVAREPLSVSSPDGAIDAPVGSQARVSVVASEPLKDAWLCVGGEWLLSAATPDPATRLFSFRITGDDSAELVILSDRDVRGAGQQPLPIRAIPDRAPLARFAAPGADLLVRPRDVVEIPYQVADDYGLASVEAKVQINEREPAVLPLPFGDDPRRSDSALRLDLAEWGVTIGDVVGISLAATDRAGQMTAASPCRLLIAPRAVTTDERRAVSELREAARVASLILADLEQAAAASEAPPSRAATMRLAAASERSPLLVRTLLRAVVNRRTRPQADLIAGVADTAQILASRLDQLSASATILSTQQRKADIDALRDMAAGMPTALNDLWRGLLAQSLLDQRANLAALEQREGVAGVALDHLRQEIKLSAEQLQLDPAASDFEARLSAIVEISERAGRAAAPLDLVEIAARWAAAARPAEMLLPERLGVAAQVEAVRADANLIRAADLQLASRAARTLDALVAPTTQPAPTGDPRSGYVAALAALQREHLLSTHAQDAASSVATRAEAAQARLTMRALAGEAELVPGAWNSLAASHTAMHASALASQRQYAQASAIDAKLFESAPQARKRVDSEMRRAVQIDSLEAQQQALRDQPRRGDTAGRQHDLAERIDQVRRRDHPSAPQEDSRDLALATVRRAQQVLAEMPQSLAKVEQMSAWSRQTRQRAEQARQDAEQAGADQRPAARRAAGAAQQQADDAFGWLAQSGQALEPGDMWRLAKELWTYAPETAPAVESIEGLLAPALISLRDGIDARDPEEVERRTREARLAIAAAQEGLRDARRALLERDPLVAARWFAQEAASSLASTQPATSPAHSNQSEVLAALGRAWDDSIHRAATARLAGLSSMAAIFRFYGADGVARGAPPPGSSDPAAWDRLQDWRADEISHSGREPDPPGYRDALRVYFKALNQGRSEVQP